MPTLDELREEFTFLDRDDRTHMLVDLGRSMEPMPEALKTDSSLVRGCQAKVWVYPTQRPDGALHFYADSESDLTKGMIALVLATVQDRKPEAVFATDIRSQLAPFGIEKHLTSVRTSGLLNMMAVVHETAARYAAGEA